MFLFNPNTMLCITTPSQLESMLSELRWAGGKDNPSKLS